LFVSHALVAFSLLAGCAGGPDQASVPKPGVQTGTRFELSLEPGPAYAKDMKVFLFKDTVWPQVAYGNDLAARLPAGTCIVKLETNRL
jgi:hypothetical protein